MTPSLLLAALLTATPPSLSPAACAHAAPGPTDPDAYRELWDAGQSWEAFLAEAESRRELWLENWATSEGVDQAVVDRARAAGGTWYVLAVAIDACSDSVSTIPFLARLASQVEGLELRIVDSDAGAWIMNENQTPDGRPATPTVVLLSPDFEKRGCFVERPTPLQTRIIENPDGLGQREIFDFKMGWYAEDRGASTVEEFVEILEAATSGSTRCG
jgi:hypothetical protein